MVLACLSLTSGQDQCGKICFAAGGSSEHALFLQTQTNIAMNDANTHVTFVPFIQTGRKHGGSISSLVPMEIT